MLIRQRLLGTGRSTGRRHAGGAAAGPGRAWRSTSYMGSDPDARVVLLSSSVSLSNWAFDT